MTIFLKAVLVCKESYSKSSIINWSRYSLMKFSQTTIVLKAVLVCKETVHLKSLLSNGYAIV